MKYICDTTLKNGLGIDKNEFFDLFAEVPNFIIPTQVGIQFGIAFVLDYSGFHLSME